MPEHNTSRQKHKRCFLRGKIEKTDSEEANASFCMIGGNRKVDNEIPPFVLVFCMHRVCPAVCVCVYTFHASLSLSFDVWFFDPLDIIAQSFCGGFSL